MHLPSDCCDTQYGTLLEAMQITQIGWQILIGTIASAFSRTPGVTMTTAREHCNIK
jgi:hypothetical protein